METCTSAPGRPCCDVCHCVKRPLVCSRCVNETRQVFRKELQLNELKSQRNALQAELESKMDKRICYDRRMIRVTRLQSAQRHLLETRLEAERKLRTLSEGVAKTKERNRRRLEGFGEAAKKLRESVAKQNKMDWQHRYEHTLLRASEQEATSIMTSGFVDLAKQIGPRRTIHGIEILGTVLPRMVDSPVPEMTKEARRNLGSVIGYVYLLVDRLSYALRVPLLHFGRFECSTSHVMKPDRIFDQHSHHPWTKHRLYLSTPDSMDDEGNWQELVAGVRLMKRSLVCIASALSITPNNPNISFFDLLFLVLARVTSTSTDAVFVERDTAVKDEELVGGVDDDWCEISSMVLPPPPSADDDIVQYETAMGMGQDLRQSVTDSIRFLIPKFPATARWMSATTSFHKAFISDKK